MSLAKAILQGKVTRKPEKRFSSNNVAVTTFAINISPNEDESLIRVVTLGKNAELAEQKLQQGVSVIVEGRLQTNAIKTADGEDKKVVELEAQNFEILGVQTAQASSKAGEEDILQLSDDDFSDDLIGEDEIPF
ncbi:MAG: single-stranded DNA-binding protein [Candidatus Gastranaerophilales bacterium]|nr:single-stranded DNA-binding protein [Candidatus Gastranaerophilales bacterium]